MSEEKKPGILGTILSALKLDWVRPLIYKVGGRKMVATGGALFVIERIVTAAGTALTWPHAIACVSVAAVSIGMAFATASEDKAEKGNGLKEIKE